MKNLIIIIISWIDRNYNLIFRKSDVIDITVNTIYKYNDIIAMDKGTQLRYLCKNKYKLLRK